MSLVFAGIMPHSPLLLPTIGKDHCSRAKKTLDAVTELREELYVSKPDIIIILSPHEGRYNDAFVAHVHDRINIDLSSMGDMVTDQSWPGAPHIAAELASYAATAHIELRQVTQESVHIGTTTPLLSLVDTMSDTPILPIGFSNKSISDHLAFGEMLKEYIAQTSKRIAVIVTGDLSRRHNNTNPQGADPSADMFDRELITLLEHKNVAGFVAMNQTLVTQASECIYRSIGILFGLLKGTRYQPRTLSYEHPFGIGYYVGLIDFGV